MGLKAQLTFYFVLLLSSTAWAGWASPQDVVVGTWGGNIGQFYFYAGESGDFFSKEFGVDKDGLVVIPDEGNKRIVIYDSDGTIKKNLYKPESLPEVDNSDGWPSIFFLHKGGNSSMITCNYEKVGAGQRPLNMCVMDYSGTVLSKIEVGEIFPIETGYIHLRNNKYGLYSPTGQLIKTYTEEPLELGRVTENKLKSGKYRVTVKYPDKEWNIIGRGVDPGYTRDMNGNLYGYGERQVSRYDSCGKELALLTMPEKQMLQESRGPEVEPKITVFEEYGSPVIAPNGDVYTWKRTPDNYSIIKWTWTDDPNAPGGPDAPTNPAVTPAANGLSLTWKKSPQDPGCVEGYEIERSSTSGGIFSNITITAPAVVKYTDTGAFAASTYYYRIRAKSSCGPSPYTAEISGKRP